MSHKCHTTYQLSLIPLTYQLSLTTRFSDSRGCGSSLVAKFYPSLLGPYGRVSSPSGSSLHGTSQARILEWVAFSFSRGTSQPRDGTCISCFAGRFFTTEPPGKPDSRGSNRHSQRKSKTFQTMIGNQIRKKLLWNIIGPHTSLSLHFIVQQFEVCLECRSGTRREVFTTLD